VRTCTQQQPHPPPYPPHPHPPPPGNALKTNITTLGPLVLPVSEQLLFGANLVARKLLGKKRVPNYIPDFKLAFEHVCIHTGGFSGAALRAPCLPRAPRLACSLLPPPSQRTSRRARPLPSPHPNPGSNPDPPTHPPTPHPTRPPTPPGGRGVIDEIEKQLALSPAMVEPSRAVLYRYGNISSSSIWWVGRGGVHAASLPSREAVARASRSCQPPGHPLSPRLPHSPSQPHPTPPPRYVLSYIESTGGVRKGDRIWQLGFGSGFKCNSAVWRAKRCAWARGPGACRGRSRGCGLAGSGMPGASAGPRVGTRRLTPPPPLSLLLPPSRVREAHFAWDGFDIEKMRADLTEMPH
jgi:hypothetical protein